MHPKLQEHADALKRLYPGSDVTPLSDGRAWVFVPKIDLPEGWSKESTPVYFLTPVGYPLAQPDCFYAEETLRLRSGGMPTNANMQPSPADSRQLLWFSW